MRYLASILALAGAVAAQTSGFDAITNPGSTGITLTVGEAFDITWDYNSQWPSTSTILLIGGPSSNQLETIETITTSVENSAGSYQWTVDVQPTEAVYGFKIVWNTDNSVFQYSFPFAITSSASTTVGSKPTSASLPDKSWSSTTAQSKPSTTGIPAKDWSSTGSGSDDDCDATDITGGSWAGSATTVADPISTLTWSQGSWSDNRTVAPSWTTGVSPGWTTGVAPGWTTVAVAATTQEPAGWVAPAYSTAASAAEAATTSIVTAGASSVVAGGFAMFGGVAMVVLAL